ncbi:chromosome partitioning protein [Bartonella sp. AU55XJBT]|uniref:chromosome partitioning protein n=1 Tax=Bartonella sp. AU55XJBT TaxID=3019091 RepID=UPI00235F1741
MTKKAKKIRACVFPFKNAALLEVAENLFRNELSVIDRALFVQTYRELWEKKYGEIQRGGDHGNQYTKDKVAKVQVAPLPKDGSVEHNETGCEGDRKSKVQVAPLIGGETDFEQLVQLAPIAQIEGKDGKGTVLSFAKHVADRIGFSQDVVKRLNSIARHLQPELRSVLRGTALADNQAQLLKLAKMEPVSQRRVAIALQQVEGDLRRAVDLVNGINTPPQINEQERIFAQLLSVWQRADAQTRARFYDYLNKQSGEGQA